MKGKPLHIGYKEISNTVTQENVSADDVFVSESFCMVRDSRFVMGRLLSFGIPYLIEDMRVGVIENGQAVIVVNLQQYTLKKGDMVILPYGTIVTPLSASPDFQLFAFLTSPEFFGYAMGHDYVGHLQERSSPLIPHEEADFLTCSEMLQNMWHILHRYGFQRPLLAASVALYYRFIAYVEERQRASLTQREPHADDVFARFLQLASAHCHHAHTLDFYAERLCLSRHYLGTLIKDTSGLTAKQWIDRALITRAKVLLKSSDLQAAEISHQLGFANPSFFSKFFKRLTGVTPQRYKEL